MAGELDNLIAQVRRTTDVHDSAIKLLEGIAGRIQAAIDAAIAGGASPAVLAQVQGEANTLRDSAERLAQAVVANTPGQVSA